MDLDNRFTTTEYFIEATSFEQRVLLYQNELLDEKYTVEVENLGIGSTIGYLAKRPVYLNFSWAKINGHRICFYNPTSQVVDWVMTTDFLSKQFPVYREHHTDANGFVRVLGYIKRAS
uniref:Uncharacterized protein n=1 Tax=Marseillevirus LCMAC201 TaxID=2506605 RepID=A0A481YXU3_9VIRU|nr:MAG: hypothetical protein LCMAC201_02740 [Marseillevirus LCMAC201]